MTPFLMVFFRSTFFNFSWTGVSDNKKNTNKSKEFKNLMLISLSKTVVMHQLETDHCCYMLGWKRTELSFNSNISGKFSEFHEYSEFTFL